jgi:RHS repeat-associated protein
VLEAWKPSAKPPFDVVNWVAGPPHISIDSNGNLAQKVEGSTTWTYEWNAENQLTRVLSNGSAVARYKYDPLGRRVEKVAGGVTTTWAYDAEDILRQVGGSTTFRYVHGPEVDEPLAREDSGALSYYNADALMSVVALTNQAGTVIRSVRYDSWGRIEQGADAGYGFAGREWEPEIGAYYVRARYLDPTGGRFLSEDPIRFDGGVNFYAYVGGNPVRWTDPTGLIPDTPPVTGPPGSPDPGVLCMGYEFSYAVGLGQDHGWRYAHCMASCRTKKNCGALHSKVAQWSKEHLWDMTACLVAGRQDNCNSWGQDSDFDDNNLGFTCPENQSCFDRCEELRGAPETPPGPFWWTGCFLRGQCGPMSIMQRTLRR